MNGGSAPPAGCTHRRQRRWIKVQAGLLLGAWLFLFYVLWTRWDADPYNNTARIIVFIFWALSAPPVMLLNRDLENLLSEILTCHNAWCRRRSRLLGDD